MERKKCTLGLRKRKASLPESDKIKIPEEIHNTSAKDGTDITCNHKMTGGKICPNSLGKNFKKKQRIASGIQKLILKESKGSKIKSRKVKG